MRLAIGLPAESLTAMTPPFVSPDAPSTTTVIRVLGLSGSILHDTFICASLFFEKPPNNGAPETGLQHLDQGLCLARRPNGTIFQLREQTPPGMPGRRQLARSERGETRFR